jgi:hypothetical protein
MRFHSLDVALTGLVVVHGGHTNNLAPSEQIKGKLYQYSGEIKLETIMEWKITKGRRIGSKVRPIKQNEEILVDP